jgi:hypothetical protein
MPAGAYTLSRRPTAPMTGSRYLMPPPAADDYIPLGPVPCDEDHAEIGMPDYAAKAHKECRAYIQAIRRKVGREPEGARLATMEFHHADFGTYYEVVCHFDSGHPASVRYAQRCDEQAPQSWGEVGMTPPVPYGRQMYGGR